MSFFANTIEFVTRLSTDTLILIFLLVGLSIATLYLGKDKIIAFIFSLFIAQSLFVLIPFNLPENTWYLFGTKVIFALVITIILQRFIRSEHSYKKSRRYGQSLLLALIGLMALLASGLVDAYTFSPFIARWFEGDFLFWSSLAPFILLFFVIRK